MTMIMKLIPMILKLLDQGNLNLNRFTKMIIRSFQTSSLQDWKSHLLAYSRLSSEEQQDLHGIKPKEASSSEGQQDLHGKKKRGEGVKDNRPYWP